MEAFRFGTDTIVDNAANNAPKIAKSIGDPRSLDEIEPTEMPEEVRFLNQSHGAKGVVIGTGYCLACTEQRRTTPYQDA